MSKEDPNNLNAYHNQGQEDASEGKFDPPNNTVLHEFISQEHERDQKAAYITGYKNAKDR
jgi:hypothetical protein